MANGEQERRVPKGTVIFRQGDPGDEMFVVSEGRVRLTLGSGGLEKEIAVMNVGDFFGELSLLNGAARSATAEAAEDSTLLAIGRDVFKMMMQDDLDIVFRMMDSQGRRLSRTNEPIQELMQRLGRIRIAAHSMHRYVAANGQLPLVIELATLGQDLKVGAPTVQATVADLAQRGIGVLQDGRWTFQSREHIDKLIEAICSYAEAPPERS
jgi:CRP-like cAMP-binding protein